MDIKPGVLVKGLQPEILLAIIVAQEVYHVHGYVLTITSLLDGHEGRPNSLHNKGLAVDLRTRIFVDYPALTTAENIAADIRRRLTDDYDVVVETDHIHVEFDPK